MTYVAALGIMLAAAALASHLPARRASAMDPVEALKAE
jgi:ABC-type lipoprotein release transport system permease subunit